MSHTTLELTATTPVGPDGVTVLRYAPAGVAQQA